MATFGDLVEHSNDGSFLSGEMQLCKFSVATAAIVSSMSAFTRVASGTGKMRFAIFDDDGEPNVLKWVSSEKTFTNTTFAWNSANVLGTWSNLAAGNYWLCVWPGASIIVAYGTYPAGTGWWVEGKTYHATNNPASPFTGGEDYDVNINVYATYTVPASGNPYYYRAQQ